MGFDAGTQDPVGCPGPLRTVLHPDYSPLFPHDRVPCFHQSTALTNYPTRPTSAQSVDSSFSPLPQLDDHRVCVLVSVIHGALTLQGGSSYNSPSLLYLSSSLGGCE